MAGDPTATIEGDHIKYKKKVVFAMFLGFRKKNLHFFLWVEKHFFFFVKRGNK